MSVPSGHPTGVAPHGESHLAILRKFRPDGGRRVDAVVVPTARGAAHLLDAGRLAAELGAVLLALCSACSRAAEAAAVLDGVAGLQWHAVDIPSDYRHPLLPPARDAGETGRASLSRKRNLGLLVARMVGWETLLFLDDDIRGVDATIVRLAAGGLGPAAAVGLTVERFPDNSVVCHANRLGGGAQTVFVSGAALLVDVMADDLGHFPTVYNEDWLFLYDALQAGRVRREGVVRQLRYDPFARPRRAAEEEFGEVLAEGLVAHIEAGGGDVPLNTGYWDEFLQRRAAFLARTRSRVAASRPSPRRMQALRSLRAAADRLARIDPADCVGFLRQWRLDRADWRARLATMARAEGVVPALLRLGLDRHHVGRLGTGTPARGIAVIVPGFLDGSASPAHRSMTGQLTSAGLRAVPLDLRGSDGRPGAPVTVGPSEHLDDLDSLLDLHVGDGGGMVAVVGHCYGGWLAGLLAARDPRITHVVALMPTRCFLWPDDYDEGRDRWRRRGELLVSSPVPGTQVLKAVRLPHALVIDALRHDLPAALRDLRIPILFVAGSDDETVPAASVQRLYGECGSPAKEIVVLAGVQHDYRDHPDQLARVQDAVLDWLGRPALSAPPTPTVSPVSAAGCS